MRAGARSWITQIQRRIMTFNSLYSGHRNSCRNSPLSLSLRDKETPRRNFRVNFKPIIIKLADRGLLVKIIKSNRLVILCLLKKMKKRSIMKGNPIMPTVLRSKSIIALTRQKSALECVRKSFNQWPVLKTN